MKQLLASQEILHPRLFPSILSAIQPILAIDRTGVSVRNLIGQASANRDEEEQDIDEL